MSAIITVVAWFGLIALIVGCYIREVLRDLKDEPRRSASYYECEQIWRRDG